MAVIDSDYECPWCYFFTENVQKYKVSKLLIDDPTV